MTTRGGTSRSRFAAAVAVAIVSTIPPAAGAIETQPTGAGIDPTGVEDSTTGLQKALSAAAAKHRPLDLCGRFRISRALEIATTDGDHDTSSGIVGCSEGGARIELTDPRQDGIVFSGATFGQQRSCVLKNVTIAAPIDVKTAGYGVHLVNTNRCIVSHDTFDGMFVGIGLTNTALSLVEDNAIIDTSVGPGSGAIALDGADVNSYIIRNYADNNPAHAPSFGISLVDTVNGDYVEDNSMSHFEIGLRVDPGRNGKIQNIFLRQNAFDLCLTAGAAFEARGAASIVRIFSVNDWFAATARGPGLITKGTGLMANWQFDTTQVRDNGGDGLSLGGHLQDVVFNALVATANNAARVLTSFGGSISGSVLTVSGVSSGQVSVGAPLHGAGVAPGTIVTAARSGTGGAGIYGVNIPQTVAMEAMTQTDDRREGAGVALGPDVSHIAFRGGIAGHTAEEFDTQSYGFTIEDGADAIEISDVDVSKNTDAGILNHALHARHIVMHDNPGFNPPAAVNPAVTLGPSPFAYRAGPSPETLYLSGGTCSTVKQNGALIARDCSAQASYALGPNETLDIVYTSAPRMTRIVH